MKSIFPDPDQLDELAAGLDAGWDEAPIESTASEPPHSGPLPASLDELDADWETQAPALAAVPQRAAQVRPGAVRPSPARPSPTRAVTPATVNGALPLRMSKQERRDAERQRRTHQAQQKAAKKKERKAERQTEARRAAEELRAAQQRAALDARAREGKARKRKAGRPSSARSAGKPEAQLERKRRRATASVTVSPVLAEPGPQPVAARSDRGPALYVILLCLALLFGGTIYFALSRSH